MPGKQPTRYRALRGLNYQTDPAIIRRHKLGDVRPGDYARTRRVEPGEIVEDMPAHAVAIYLAKGCIEPVADDPATEEARP